MKALFVNPNTRSLRAGWRIMAFAVVFAAITSGTMLAIRSALGGLRKGSNLQFAILAVTATLSVMIARRYFDKRPFRSLGLTWDRYAFLDLLAGITNSAALMGGMFVLLLSTKLIDFNGYTWWREPGALQAGRGAMAWSELAGVLFQLAIVAWWEELVFRGYVFQNLVTGTNVIWATVITSVFFGLGHALNPNASVLSTLLIVAITPQLIYAYVKTGQLWLPVGLHLGWNFFQASVFGFAASGQALPSLLSQTPVGPEWLSGGAFGAEGSILILPLTGLSLLAIHFWVTKTRFQGQALFGVAPGTS
jgi:CAAX protease family protein